MGEGQAEAWRQRTRLSAEGASAWLNTDELIEAMGRMAQVAEDHPLVKKKRKM